MTDHIARSTLRPLDASRRRALQAVSLALGTTVTSVLTGTSPAVAKAAGAIALRVSNGKGAATVTAPLAQFVHVTLAPGSSFGLRARQIEATGEIQVEVSRTTAKGQPASLQPGDFAPYRRLSFRPGASTSMPLAQGATLDVSVAAGVVMASEGEGCNCCVLCDNGVTICGCRFQSSCGNCP